MKNIFLLSNDLFLLTRWEKLINHNVVIIDSPSEIQELKESILIITNSMCKDIDDRVIIEFIAKQNQILLLDNTPNFTNAQKHLSLGIKGYGNTLMTSSYLNAALEALNNDFIWLLPAITTHFVNNIVNSKNAENKNNEEVVFECLTVKEKSIASLLKKGYTNNKISQELNISINTVKTHIKHIYDKLDVKDRLSFATLFTR